jgi:hypothetical protein
MHSRLSETARRELRARNAALADLADQVEQLGGRGGTARRLVQVYDGGAIPTAPDKFYFTRPVELDGTETEGGSGTPAADTNQTIPVDVIGGTASAGDLLIAYAIGGRWVAEKRTGGTGTVACTGCDAPNADLILTEVGTGTPFGGGCFNGTYTLHLGQGPLKWETDTNRRTCGSMEYYYWDMGCVTGVWVARYYTSLTGTPGSFTLSYSSLNTEGLNHMITDSQTCGGTGVFDWKLHVCTANNCAIGEWTWEITG